MIAEGQPVSRHQRLPFVGVRRGALVAPGRQGELARGRFGGIEPDGAMRLVHEDGTTSLVRAGDVQLG